MSQGKPSPLHSLKSTGCNAGPSDSGPSLGLSTPNTPSEIHSGQHIYSGLALDSLNSCNYCFCGELVHNGLLIASLNLRKLHLFILNEVMTIFLLKLISDSLWTKFQIPISRVSALAIHHLHINEPQPRAVALLDLEYLAQSHAKIDHQQVIEAGALNQTSSNR